jgi:hypothetical protein
MNSASLSRWTPKTLAPASRSPACTSNAAKGSASTTRIERPQSTELSIENLNWKTHGIYRSVSGRTFPRIRVKPSTKRVHRRVDGPQGTPFDHVDTLNRRKLNNMQSHDREQNQNQDNDDPTFIGWQYENGAIVITVEGSGDEGVDGERFSPSNHTSASSAHRKF